MIFKPGKINLYGLFSQFEKTENSQKLSLISEHFLGTPYKKDSLNSGDQDKEELIVDFEGVDCMTFIEYVEALRISSDFDSFVKNLQFVRYSNGIVDFVNRRHFFIDWNSIPSVKNITKEIGGIYCKRVSKQLNKADNGKFWIEGVPSKQVEIYYIEKDNIGEILYKLDSCYYVGFYSSKKGLDVNHVGILFNNKDGLILRHASSIRKKVIDEPFLEYIKDKEGIIIYKTLC